MGKGEVSKYEMSMPPVPAGTEISKPAARAAPHANAQQSPSKRDGRDDAEERVRAVGRSVAPLLVKVIAK